MWHYFLYFAFRTRWLWFFLFLNVKKFLKKNTFKISTLVSVEFKPIIKRELIHEQICHQKERPMQVQIYCSRQGQIVFCNETNLWIWLHRNASSVILEGVLLNRQSSFWWIPTVIELNLKDTTDTARSASYIDIHHESDNP